MAIDRDEAIRVLTAALNDPAQSARHDEIRAALSRQQQAAPPEIKARQTATAAPTATPKMQVDLGLGPREYDDTNDVVPRVVRGLKRIDQAVTGPITALNKAVDTASGGLYSRGSRALKEATGLQVGPTPEQYDELARTHPAANNMATAAGIVNPEGVASLEARGVGAAVDILGAIARRRATSKVGKALVNTGVNAVKGAGSNALFSATESMTGGDSLDKGLEKAKESAKVGAGVGAGIGLVAPAAGALASKMRANSPDLQVLHEAGLEPGPFPGRPVVREDLPLREQLPGLSEPPLVRKATPATRASAARVAADEIAPDIKGRKTANNKRFGELQAEAYAKEGKNPAPYNHILADIDARLANQRLPDATRKALGDVRAKFEPYMETAVNPELDAMQKQMAGASPQQRARLQAHIDAIQGDMPQSKPFTAQDLDEIRDYTDSKVKSGEIGQGDVQFIQLRQNMRDTLARPGVGPGIAALNDRQSKIMSGFGKRRALLGMKRDQRGEGEDVYEAMARQIASPGEETKFSGGKTGRGGHAVERAAEMGAPPVLPGTTGLPGEVDYKALLKVPRLQLAQENLQIPPSKVFSGGGIGSAMTLPLRMGALTAPRVVYPLARRAGEMGVGTKPMLADELINAVRRRGKKKRKQGAEMSTGGATD